MAEFPALPLWTDAYLGDTTHLTTLENGAYLLLLMVAWRSRDCCLPDDDALLARYAKMTRGQWKRIRPIIAPFFDIENGVWRQRRLTDEYNAVRQKRESARANGQASALKRKERHSTERQRSVNETSTPISRSISRESLSESSSPYDSARQEAEGEDGQSPAVRVREAWNAIAERCDLARILTMTDKRKKHLAARIAEHGITNVLIAIGHIPDRPFLIGKGERGWKCDFDWLLQPASIPQILEGQRFREIYSNGKKSAWRE